MGPSSGRYCLPDAPSAAKSTISGADEPEKRSGWLSIGIVVAIAVGIYTLSPGAMHYYKHGRLPD